MGTRYRDQEKIVVDVSVVVPVYRGIAWISKCLNSLSEQTLSKDRYEVVVVFNGPDDGSIEWVRRFGEEHTDLQLRLLKSPVASAPHARNLGTAAARGTFLTWVDCDDWVSPEYLELLLLSARSGIVPLAQIVNVFADGSMDSRNLINKSILDQKSHIVSPSDFHRGLSFMTCKLIPTWMAKSVPFEENLRSGEDVALFARMYSRYQFRFNLIPALAGAKYYRLMRDSSISRQSASFDFMVTQRLDVVESLNLSLMDCRPEAVPLVKSFINSQASFVKRYLASHAEEREVVADELAVRLFTYFPWTALFQEVSTLVVAYNFVPYADTGGIVAAKRLRDMEEPVDVVSHRMDNVRRQHASHHAIAQPFVQFISFIDGPAVFAGYAGISDFCVRGMLSIESWKGNYGRAYRKIYSRAMWPASHFLAALYKVRNPSVLWTAEFSDPIQLDSNGIFRHAPIVIDAVAEEILAALPEVDREALVDNQNVYFWTEYLAYVLADNLVFTNENQRRVMSGYAGERASTAIAEKSSVSHQPTLAPSFYEVGSARLELDPEVVNVGYFGEFYTTRGLDEVLEALSSADFSNVRDVRLHVFTSNPEAAEAMLYRFDGLDERVCVHPSLGYFDFLSALKQFDCLVINDAVTTGLHEVNPYLPSKLSDYRGAGTRIWAVVEPGSVLSLTGNDYVSVVGDVTGAGQVICDLAELPTAS